MLMAWDFGVLNAVIAGASLAIIYWLKQGGRSARACGRNRSEVGELDELETFVGSKKKKSGSGRLLTTFGEILGWVLGDHSANI